MMLFYKLAIYKSFCCLGIFSTYYVISFIVASNILFIFKTIFVHISVLFSGCFFISHLLHIWVIDLIIVYFIMISCGWFHILQPLKLWFFQIWTSFIYILCIFFTALEKDDLFYCVWVKHLFSRNRGTKKQLSILGKTCTSSNWNQFQ